MLPNVPLVLSIDLGTTSVKVALVTCESNPSVVEHVSRNFGNSTLSTGSTFGSSCQNLENKQDASKIFNCLHVLLARLGHTIMARVVAIAVAGQMHGVIGWIGSGLAFNKDSKLLKKKLDVNVSSGGCGPLITWLDRRCDEQFIALLPTSTKSQRPSSGFGCATILWDINNKTGEFSVKPMSSNEELCMFERTSMLRKISADSRIIRTVHDDNCASTCAYTTSSIQSGQVKARSTSQVSSPNLLNANLDKPNFDGHPPWTNAGTIADFLVVGLTDRTKAIMSPQMASSWGYFNIKESCWDKPVLEAAGFPMHLLPEIYPCGSVVGKLAFDWEGVSAGADVFVALGDLQCSVYSYLLGEGNAACNLSTSAQIAFKMPPASFEPSGSCIDNEVKEIPLKHYLAQGKLFEWPFFRPDEKVFVAASLNGGNVIDRFVKMLRSWCKQLGCAAMEDDQVYERLIHLPMRQRSKSNVEMQISPCLFGERHAPNDFASVSQIQPEQLDLGLIYSNLCESVVHNLASMAPEKLLLSAKVKRLYCVGGALRRNPIFMECLRKEYASLECLENPNAVEACVGAGLFTVSVIMGNFLSK